MNGQVNFTYEYHNKQWVPIACPSSDEPLQEAGYTRAFSINSVDYSASFTVYRNVDSATYPFYIDMSMVEVIEGVYIRNLPNVLEFLAAYAFLIPFITE